MRTGAWSDFGKNGAVDLKLDDDQIFMRISHREIGFSRRP